MKILGPRVFRCMVYFSDRHGGSLNLLRAAFCCPCGISLVVCNILPLSGKDSEETFALMEGNAEKIAADSADMVIICVRACLATFPIPLS